MHTTFKGTGGGRYILESHEIGNGGLTWSVSEAAGDGERRVLAYGTSLCKAGQEWDHEDLVQFVRDAETKRATKH